MLRYTIVMLLSLVPVCANAQSEEACRSFGDDIYSMLERRSDAIARGENLLGRVAERENMTSPMFTADTHEAEMLFNGIFGAVVDVEYALAQMSLHERMGNIAMATRRLRAKCIDGTL